MNRTYTAHHYKNLVRKIRQTIPGVSLSTDIIAGFPTETDEDQRMTLDLIREIEFDGAFTFKYSPRENTKAWEMKDSVPEEVKTERLNEIIELQRSISFRKNQSEVGRTATILVEGESRKSSKDFCGRTDTNKMVVFPRNGEAVGSYVDVRVERANAATLFGNVV
jgi:tRNA-2-methylthio-N6-dimethylallyladenosine synthase